MLSPADQVQPESRCPSQSRVSRGSLWRVANLKTSTPIDLARFSGRRGCGELNALVLNLRSQKAPGPGAPNATPLREVRYEDPQPGKLQTGSTRGLFVV